MPRVAEEAPHGDEWVFRADPGRRLITFEIWNGREYVPVYNNEGQPYNFSPELAYCRGTMQMRIFGERIYKAGQ